MLLYSMSKKGNKIDGVESVIADQINYDIDQLSSESPELRIEIANINELAGLKARDSSDHVRSSSYFTCAMSLLPTDRWKIHYEISLRVSFLLAESFHIRGESAEGILAEILEECHSFEDKLPAIFLLVASKFVTSFALNFTSFILTLSSSCCISPFQQSKTWRCILHLL